MRKKETKTFKSPLELKFAGDEGATEKSIVGYGAYFDNQDAYGDVIAPGAFTKSLAEHRSAGTMPAMLFNHKSIDMPIGKWTAIAEDDNGLRCEGVFIDTVAGNDAHTAAKAGAITGLSIGFYVTGFEMTKVGDENVRLITEVKLFEVSLVTFPANDMARVDEVKSVEDDDLQTILSDAGFDEDAIAALMASRKSDEDEDEEMSNDLDEDEDEALSDDIEDDETLSDEDDDEELADDLDDEGKTLTAKYKYIMTARIAAVRKLIVEMTTENNG